MFFCKLFDKTAPSIFYDGVYEVNVKVPTRCDWTALGTSSLNAATCWNQTAFSERWEGATRQVSCCVWMCEHKDLLGTRRRWGERATWLRSHVKLVFRHWLQQSKSAPDSLRGAVFWESVSKGSGKEPESPKGSGKEPESVESTSKPVLRYVWFTV